MNFTKIISGILALNLLALSLFAQEKPKARLVTEYSQHTNGYVKMLLDNFFIELQNNPQATGYIFSYGSARQIARHERLVKNYTQLRRFEIERLVLVNGGVQTKQNFQYWLVPAGAEPPNPNKKEYVDSCPEVSIISPPTAVESGETMTFTAKVKGDVKVNVYNWSLDKGTILSGQGTSTITVGTDGLDDTVITASVSIKGEFLDACKAEATNQGIVSAKPKARLFDQFKNPNCEYHMMKLDSFFVELQNNPTATGYIITYGSTRTIAIKERQTRSYMRTRNFDSSRILLVNGGGKSKKPTIEFWILPAGADSGSIPTNPPKEDPIDVEKEIKTKPIDKTKPYIFSEEYYDGVVCYGERDEMDLEGYAQILKENPKARGNIVIILDTKAEFREKEKEIIKFLTDKGIARKRLRTFHVKGFGGVELWFLP